MPAPLRLLAQLHALDQVAVEPGVVLVGVPFAQARVEAVFLSKSVVQVDR